jgi:hypothetical protein
LGYSEESIVALIREGVTQIAVSPK